MSNVYICWKRFPLAFSTIVKYLKCITYRLYTDGADLSNIAFYICQACFLSATQIIHRWWRLHLFKPGRDSKGGQFKVTEVNLRFICLRDRSISICPKDQSIILIVSNTLSLCNSDPPNKIWMPTYRHRKIQSQNSNNPALFVKWSLHSYIEELEVLAKMI